MKKESLLELLFVVFHLVIAIWKTRHVGVSLQYIKHMRYGGIKCGFNLIYHSHYYITRYMDQFKIWVIVTQQEGEQEKFISFAVKLMHTLSKI